MLTHLHNSSPKLVVEPTTERVSPSSSSTPLSTRRANTSTHINKHHCRVFLGFPEIFTLFFFAIGKFYKVGGRKARQAGVSRALSQLSLKGVVFLRSIEGGRCCDQDLAYVVDKTRAREGSLCSSLPGLMELAWRRYQVFFCELEPRLMVSAHDKLPTLPVPVIFGVFL